MINSISGKKLHHVFLFLGLRAVDKAQTNQMKQLLDVKPIRELKRGAQRFEGALMKVSTRVDRP